MGVSSLCPAPRTLAGPWSTQPLVGLAAEYASNPTLSGSPNAPSETHAAVFADLPVNFDGDEFHFSLTPRVRYGDTSGYSSVTSNYYHVDATALYATEFYSLSLAGAFYRDASLLYAGELANGIGVRRDTTTVQANWLQELTERVQFDCNANAARTLYTQDQLASALTDYKYGAVSPSVGYTLDERDTLRIIYSNSRYDSLNGFTGSRSNNLQLGLDRRLSEIWTLSASAGYSKSTDQYHFFFGTFETRQNGAVYSLSLSRPGERLDFSATASRALTPTGFSFLSRQDNVGLNVTYKQSERWTFSAAGTAANLNNPALAGGYVKYRYYSASGSATWHWTEHWNVALRAQKVEQIYSQASGNPVASGVSLEISRQFYRTNQ